MFSISRFALLTIDFGAIFIVQFLLLSLCFGIPLLTFFLSTGQYLGSGLIDMWRISPIFQGVGVSLMLVQGMSGVYSIVITSWMFVYFRDSFITIHQPYKWSRCEKDVPAFENLRHCHQQNANQNWSLEQVIPDYFAATVLQRSSPEYPQPAFGNLKFQVAFNLVVIWMIVFICLSKGLRSYGKVVYVFGTLPIIGFVVFACKILALFPLVSFQSWLYNQDWSLFIYNKNAWVCAAKECFLTWSFFGGSLLQLASHNKFSHNLRRDTILLAIITLAFLTVSGVLGVAVHTLLEGSGEYSYVPSSFETDRSYSFLKNRQSSGFPSNCLKSQRSEEWEHVSFLAGVRVIPKCRDTDRESGYQVHRLGTELIPAYFSTIPPTVLSPFWVVLFYFTLIMLGIAQALALFHSVIQGMIAIKPSGLKSWEGSITFCVCTVGFVLGLPIGTEVGVFVVYFLDYTLGSAWWVMVLYLIQMFAVLMVRGKPYGSQQVASLLFPKKACCSGWLAPSLAFTWNVVLPVALLIMSVVTFKTGLVSEMFDWQEGGYIYLPSWVREIGSMLQLMPLLIVPFVGVIQTCRYFLHGPDDLFDRLEMLYRPNFNSRLSSSSTSTTGRGGGRGRGGNQDVVLTNFSASATTPTPPQANDPPPKYTPPPSYSTATGARIARMLRQSFRRSVRRLQSGLSSDPPRWKPPPTSGPPPPDYATVIIESSRVAAHHVREHSDPEQLYCDPTDAISFEMVSPPRSQQEELGAFSLQVNLPSQSTSTDPDLPDFMDFPSLQRRSIRSSGRVLALGVGMGALQRTDSEAVLVETAEPIHADSADEDDAIEVRSISEDGFGPAEYVESGDEADRGEVELEAVNPHVILRERAAGQHGQVITINMDTTSSVI